jgi:hypothetical protein
VRPKQVIYCPNFVNKEEEEEEEKKTLTVKKTARLIQS